MGLYGSNPLKTLEAEATSNAVMEMFLVDDILRMPSKNIRNFCESEEAKILVEKAVLRKPTLIRLGKDADKNRRVKLIAYKLAKEANSPHYRKLKDYTAKRKTEINAIMKQYGHKAEKMAQIAQREYIKTASKGIKAAASDTDTTETK